MASEEQAQNPRLEIWVRIKLLSHGFSVYTLHQRAAPNELLMELVADDETEDEAILIASRIHQNAIANAVGVNSRSVQMVATAYKRKDKKGQKERFTFAIRAAEHLETSDNEGLQAQLMRHLEGLNRTNNAAMGTVLGTYERMLRRVSEQNEILMRQQGELLDKRVEAVAVLESLLTDQHSRDLETQKQAEWSEMMHEGLRKVGMLAPAVAAKLTGSNAPMQLTGGRTPRDAAIEALIESLKHDPDRLSAIMGNLKPEEMAAFSAIVQSTETGTDTD